MKNPHLFIFAGEPSGDLHGAYLVKALKSLIPTATITGVCGPEMRKEAIKNVMSMEEFAVMGFSDVLKSLPKLIRQFYQIGDYILKTQPKAVILIDYPGFNLRMASTLRKKGFKGKIIQYISPTVWAWGKKRIGQMAETLDCLLTIFPFEKAHFDHTDLKVHFVGNPLLEYAKSYKYCSDWKKHLNLPKENSIIAIFPGSRSGEIIRNLPKQLEAAEMFKKKHPHVSFIISCVDDEIKLLVQKQLKKSSLILNQDAYLAPKTLSYELMRDSRCAMAKSGTVTLQLALHKCPTVVVYELSLLNRFIAKYLMKVNLPHYCIVNILGKSEVFPELIKAGYTSQNLYQQLISLYETTPQRNACIQSCQQICDELTESNTSQKAARIIRNLL